MSKSLPVLLLALSTAIFAQSPEGINYQAIIRDSEGAVLADQTVGLQVAILQGSSNGTPLYEETFSETTSQYGLVNIVIGDGTVTTGNFSTIDWSAGPCFVEISVDAAGGTNYTTMGTQQLMSVPFALHAKTAENVTNDQVEDADPDPTNELQSWSTLPDIPSDLTDGDDVEDADADPTNEIELPATANEGDVLVYTGGQWQPGAPGSSVFQYSSNYFYPSNTVRNTWVDYPGVSITVSETGTYYLEFYGFGQNTTMYNSNTTTTPDGDIHLRVQNTTTDETIADVTAASQYIDIGLSATVWRYINQYPSGWRVVDLNAGDVLVIQYVQYTFDDTLDGLWQMGPSGISIRKIN